MSDKPNPYESQIVAIPNGARVFIFETVTGNQHGERGTVEGFEGGRYTVRADDGALFNQTPDGVQQLGCND